MRDTQNLRKERFVSYHPHTVLRSIDQNLLAVKGFMMICLLCTFVYLRGQP